MVGLLKKDFNELYQYYKNFQISKDNPLMSWQQTYEANKPIKKEATNATDGDLDIAYALIEASKQWPNSQTNYKAAAKKLLLGIKARNYNSTNKLLTVGDWATKDSDSYNLIRPSDIVPSYFDTFAAFSGDNFWRTLKESSVKTLENLSNQHKTGLLPDFAWVEHNTVTPAEKNQIAGVNDGNYGANACRIPWRLANSNDKDVNQVLSKMMNFFLEKTRLTKATLYQGSPYHQTNPKAFRHQFFTPQTKRKPMAT